MSSFDIFKEDKSASSSFSFSFENSIFAAIGIIGLDEKPLYVFASHRHPDHFSKVIFDLEEKHPNIHYILAFDIWSKRVPESCKEKTRFLNPGQVLDDGTLKVEGFKSTDEGVAFWCSVVKTFGYEEFVRRLG